MGTAHWCFIPDRTRDVGTALRFLNFLHTEQGHMLANFGTEGQTFTWVNGNPTFTEYVTNHPRGLPLDGILRTYGLLNFPMRQDDRMSVQRFPLPQQIQAYEVWAYNDRSRYAIVNQSILPRYASEHARLITDINTFIEESRAQFISGALPLARYDDYIANLRRMGMDRVLQILQASYEAYNRR
jgi:putative aldouronate transport system substrate-binding protein